MHESIPLGRVAGMKVGAHWSLLVVVWLIAWSLADDELPSSAPHHTHAAYWLVGLGAAVIFFACLLAHELSHSLVARRHGVQVDGIVLWLFGGVSQLHGDPPNADVELRIAVAGPATSALVAATFFAITRLLDATAGPSLLSAATGWLGWINGLLAAFNMVPAFPLDGGRVFRAWLWRRRGDKEEATLAAARAGRLFAFVLIALGALELVSGGVLGGVWFVFLGWFLLAASSAEANQSVIDTELTGVHVEDVMTRQPVAAPANITVQELIDGWLDRYRCSTFPLVDDRGAVVGLMTVARVKHVAPDRRPSTPALQVACPRADIAVAQIGDDIIRVISAMNRSPDQRALVFDGDVLVGIVSPSDVARTIEVSRLSHARRAG